LHVQFYLTLLDTYLPDPDERARAFAATGNIPSIRRKAEFCFKWIDSVQDLGSIETREQRRRFLLNLVCFGSDEHTSELQSLIRISYAILCWRNKREHTIR